MAPLIQARNMSCSAFSSNHRAMQFERAPMFIHALPAQTRARTFEQAGELQLVIAVQTLEYWKSLWMMPIRRLFGSVSIS
jgi:hypothetical protein